MKTLKIEFINCYGIRELKRDFDFSKDNIFVIYAPNGAMKTSFATSFQDLSNGNTTSDRIFKHRQSRRLIQDEDGVDVPKERVFVIEPFNERYKSAKISTLLVNQKLKEEYDLTYEAIEEKKEVLLKELKAASGVPKDDIEDAISEAVTGKPKQFFIALSQIEEEVLEDKQSPFAEVPYQIIFNDKVLALLNSPDFQEKLNQYMRVYDDLVSKSTFFKKGIFNHNNASDIAKNLKENGFFKADHSVYINANGTKKEVKTEADLEKVITNEKKAILSNTELSKSFEAIDKQLIKNKELKDFRSHLEKNNVLLPELGNLQQLRRTLWIGYLTRSSGLYRQLLDVYITGKVTIENIVKRAREEKTKWTEVIAIFNRRFSVPFKVKMGNQDDVILKSEAPSITFEFVDSESGADVGIQENELWRILSNGERRALYLLNIIFEVKAREEAGQETLFVIDDIADSFDYKNKYAIIEYLDDISRQPNFYQLVLTHNFDFFRTLTSRLNVPQTNRLHATRNDSSTRLVQETYPRNPFAVWKEELNKDEMLIASIPFVRNLAEYCGIDDSHVRLTALLHLKPETPNITIKELEIIFRSVLKGNGNLTLLGPERKVTDVIYQTAAKILTERDEVIELEKKIVLSIAIRLKTEEFLIRKINNEDFVRGIKRNQTITLLRKYKDLFAKDIANIQLAERVNLMTPENIHINSFMYEPILDMSNDHLKQLYKQVCELSKQ